SLGGLQELDVALQRPADQVGPPRLVDVGDRRGFRQVRFGRRPDDRVDAADRGRCRVEGRVVRRLRDRRGDRESLPPEAIGKCSQRGVGRDERQPAFGDAVGRSVVHERHTTNVDVGELTAAGLYDESAPNAAGRLELLEYLIDQGCTVEEMVAANQRGRLFALSGDRIVIPGRDEFSLREMAERTGSDLDTVAKIWRALGFVELGPDDGLACEADLVAVQTTVDLANA